MSLHAFRILKFVHFSCAPHSLALFSMSGIWWTEGRRGKRGSGEWGVRLEQNSATRIIGRGTEDVSKVSQWQKSFCYRLT